MLRTAMEHQTVDRLLLLAHRYREFISPLTDDEYADLEAQRAAGAEWSTAVISFERSRRGAVLVRRGHDVVSDDGDVVEHTSPYWPVLTRHDATFGPATVQELFADGLINPEQLRDEANVNARLYRDYLKWEALVDNLILNDLIEEEGPQLDVHFRFLSA